MFKKPQNLGQPVVHFARDPAPFLGNRERLELRSIESMLDGDHRLVGQAFSTKSDPSL